MVLNNRWITEEIKQEIKKNLKTNENKQTKIMIQNLWDAAKVFLRGEDLVTSENRNNLR